MRNTRLTTSVRALYSVILAAALLLTSNGLIRAQPEQPHINPNLLHNTLPNLHMVEGFVVSPRQNLQLQLSAVEVWPGETFTVTAALRHPQPGIHRLNYLFLLDGKPYGSWRPENTITLALPSPGEHVLQAEVMIEYLPDIEQRGDRPPEQLASEIIPVEVRQQPTAPPPPRLNLTISPLRISLGETLTLQAHLENLPPSRGRANYRFICNQQEITPWQSEGNVVFTPREPGNYQCLAVANIQYNPDIAMMGGVSPPEVVSDIAQAVVIQRQPPENVILSLQIVPRTIHVGDSCTITATLSPYPRAGNVDYHFFIENREFTTRGNQLSCPPFAPDAYTVRAMAIITSEGNSHAIHSQPVQLLVSDKVTAQPGQRHRGVSPFFLGTIILVLLVPTALVYLLLRPHPSRVIAKIPGKLSARVGQGKTSFTADSKHDARNIEYLFTFDLGEQTIEPPTSATGSNSHGR